MNRQCLLLGLDGASFDYLEPLIREGVMPFLGRFFASAARAPLQSVVPPLTPPAWTSLVTGRSPGRHGIFDFAAPEGPGSLFQRMISSRDLSGETLWSIANRHGRRATALNFPAMHPPPAVDGCVIPGWVPGRWIRRAVRPAELFDRLKKEADVQVEALGYWPDQESKAIEGCRREEYEPWIRLHIEREREWFRALRYLMTADPTDLTAIVFDGADKLLHLCWTSIDPRSAPEPSEAPFVHLRGLCLQYFRELDSFLEALVGLAGPETTVVMASDHGFGPTDTLLSLNTWLAENGFLVWASDGPHNGEAERVHYATHEIIRGLDRARTQAVALMPSANGIWLLKDGERWREGFDSDEYRSLRVRLVEGLLDARRPDTGERVVRRVWTREEIFAGPFFERAPDLTVELVDSGHVSVARNSRAVTVRAQVMGCHRPLGVFAIGGPGVRGGAQLGVRSILDVAPTILHAMGLPIPAAVEGHVVEEAFERDWRQAHPVVHERAGAAPDAENGSGEEMDAQSREQIARRLKALGYMG
ncbi:MAG: alkaline phosphatase family protein [Candidatus Sumerlaeota bacterium]|nr:alkaline phosphatase family protein [Candidatus Sumerlaeota bacterium]